MVVTVRLRMNKVRHWKTVLFWILSIIPFLAILESASYILIWKTVPTRIASRLEERSVQSYATGRAAALSFRPKYIVASGKPSDEVESSGLRMFHPMLGWDYPPNVVYREADGTMYRQGPTGERLAATSFPTTRIASYGDSFTYCSDVAHDQTWQTYLARRLGTNVANFGVTGYGTDQAYLKYRANGSYFTDIVLLCVWPENIQRVVNSYRPFYTYNDPLGLTKPRFVRVGPSIRLEANPIQSPLELNKLTDPSFLKTLGETDYWYQFGTRYPTISWPYSLTAFRLRKPIFQNVSMSFARSSSGRASGA
jgi:hypothetical protein